MILHRIRLENYRGIERTEIELDSHGITLVEGPNEIGKSSLQEALDLVFRFPDSSRHARVDAVVPTHRDAGPEIEVELETGAYHVVYRKRFRKRPETRLEIRAPRAETRIGREAHERMDEILAETLDRPLWDALQVVQGERIDQPQLTDSATLRRALDAAAGGVGGADDCDDLFTRAEQEYLRYWTPSGQPHKDRRSQDATVRELEAQVADLDRQLGELEGTVREHEVLTARHTELAPKLPDLERSAETSRKEQEALAGLRAKVEHAREVIARAKAEAECAANRCEERAKACEKIDELERALAPLCSDDAAAADQALATARAVEQERATRVEALRGAATEAGALARLRGGDHQLRQDELHRDQLGERRQRLEKLEAEASAARKVLGRIRVNGEALERLREADLAVATARSVLEAAGVKIALRALAPVEVDLSGEHIRLELGATLDETLTERTALIVGDQLELNVEPGRGLSELRASLAEAEDKRSALLRSLGVADLSEAVSAEADRREAERTLAELDARRRSDLRDLDFEGLVMKHERQKERVERYLNGRPDRLTLPDTLEEARCLSEQANATFADAREEVDAADCELARARQHRVELETGQRERASQAQLLATQLADAERRLADARVKKTDAALAGEVDQTARALATAERTLGIHEVGLAECNPEAIEARAESDTGALARARAEHHRLENDLHALRGRLEAVRESGIAEQLARGQASLEHERAEQSRLERRARAAKLLFESLRSARDAARRAYVRPLTERIERLGSIVYGETFAIDLGEDLAIRSRTLDGITVPFTSLSTGAKEQLGILVRLAVALTVAKDGGAPLILDDSLGNTDASRLRAMGAVLRRVGRECQILVLTCTPDRFRTLGDVRVLRLAET